MSFHANSGVNYVNRQIFFVHTPPIPRARFGEHYKNEIYLIIVQRDATQSSLFIILQVHCTCFGCQPHPSFGVHITVTTAPGTGHTTKYKGI